MIDGDACLGCFLRVSIDFARGVRSRVERFLLARSENTVVLRICACIVVGAARFVIRRESATSR
jgi:hypothetical protein